MMEETAVQILHVSFVLNVSVSSVVNGCAVKLRHNSIETYKSLFVPAGLCEAKDGVVEGIGDTICNDENNIEQCRYDDNDCCTDLKCDKCSDCICGMTGTSPCGMLIIN